MNKILQILSEVNNLTIQTQELQNHLEIMWRELWYNHYSNLEHLFINIKEEFQGNEMMTFQEKNGSFLFLDKLSYSKENNFTPVSSIYENILNLTASGRELFFCFEKNILSIPLIFKDSILGVTIITSSHITPKSYELICLKIQKFLKNLEEELDKEIAQYAHQHAS